MAKTQKHETDQFYARDKGSWRQWLQQNHNREKGVWLIIYHKKGSTPSVTYEEAVEEAICFGWIDSKPNKRNEESYILFFAKRNPRSNWSKANRDRAQKMIAQGLMTEPGLEMIEIAKRTGKWTALDDAQKSVIPDDLQVAFDHNEKAFQNFSAFPPSSKRIILEWILNAKKPETRTKRIEDTVKLAEINIKANHYRQ